MLLVSWKLALPRSMFLLRGNHESATCTLMYGFKGELVAKYGKSHWRVRRGCRGDAESAGESRQGCRGKVWHLRPERQLAALRDAGWQGAAARIWEHRQDACSSCLLASCTCKCQVQAWRACGRCPSDVKLQQQADSSSRAGPGEAGSQAGQSKWAGWEAPRNFSSVTTNPASPAAPPLHPAPCIALQPVYAACKRLFSSLPLAARIGQYTLVLHGGLFRKQPQRSSGKNKRKRAHPLLYGESTGG